MATTKPATVLAVKAPATVGPAPSLSTTLNQTFTNASKQDLIQVIASGGGIIYRLDYAGNVFTSPSVGTPTPTALLTRRSGTSFQAAFPQNSGNFADVLTISNGSVVFRVDANGVAHTNS